MVSVGVVFFPAPIECVLYGRNKRDNVLTACGRNYRVNSERVARVIPRRANLMYSSDVKVFQR